MISFSYWCSDFPFLFFHFHFSCFIFFIVLSPLICIMQNWQPYTIWVLVLVFLFIGIEKWRPQRQHQQWQRNGKIGHIDLKWHFGWRCYFSDTNDLFSSIRTGRHGHIYWCFAIVSTFLFPLHIFKYLPLSLSVSVENFWHPTAKYNFDL